MNAIVLAMLAAGLTAAHQVGAKALREGIFLSTFSVADLPKAMLATALATLPTVFFVSKRMRERGPGLLAPAMFGVSALLSVFEWAGLIHAPRAVAAFVYLHVSLGGALLMSAFWSLVNERFDPHTLKKNMGRIGTGATLGGLLGGALMGVVVRQIEARTALLVLAGISGTAGFVVSRLALGGAPPAKAEGEAPARYSSYLGTLGMLVASTAASSAFADFALKTIATNHFATADELVRFFALFYTGTSFVSFVVQVLVSRPLLRHVGIGGTLAIPPTVAVALGGFALFWPSIGVVTALRGADLAFGPSLFRSAFEPLFTPVAVATKRRAKALIDILCDKGGDALASAVILGISALHVSKAPIVLAMAAASVTLYLTVRARNGYVEELQSSLQAGTLHIEAANLDATARMTLSATSAGIDRLQLLAEIERASLSASDIVEDVRALTSSDPNTVHARLTRSGLDRRLAAFIIPHLADEHLARAAVKALQGMGLAILGTLEDVLLSPDEPVDVRRRIPLVLRNLRGEAVTRVLLRAIASNEAPVRKRSALALRDVLGESGLPEEEATRVIDLAIEELGRSPPALDHAFALLSLCVDRDSVEIVRRAVHSDDQKLRGLALEFLESVLPETGRSAVIRALERGTMHAS